jgi:glycosyltransferase involved in cell wall biosynthesis
MGDYVKALKKLAEEYDNVKYMGMAPNSAIVEAEIKATLLVNPRPVGEDYTKYSFPSKNMEYMASGTPTLTTKLPGMPADHLSHVYLIEDESADGIAAVLRELLSKSREELFEKGKHAKEFILQEKNHVKQAQKLLDMIATL